MPPRNSVPPIEVLRRSREIRDQATKQQKAILATEIACRGQHNRSSELCRHSDELVRKSRDLREKLRNLRHAS